MIMTQPGITEKTETAQTAAPLRMTYEEFLDWLDDDKHAEWVNGEVIMHSPVSLHHAELGGFLLTLMTFFVEVRQLGKIAYDPFQMKIGPDFPSRAPDILFVANANLHRLKNHGLEGPADLVVEIVSPESRGRDRGDKYDEYERGGVPEYWLLDPQRKRYEFNLLGEDGFYALAPLGPDGVFRSRALEGLWLDMNWLKQEPLPPVLDVWKDWKLL
jgi:Uma2 family endonuclease